MSFNLDKVWKSGGKIIEKHHWSDRSRNRLDNARMPVFTQPVLYDVVVLDVDRHEENDYCLSIESSTDLKERSRSFELICRNTSGFFSLGRVDFDNYKTKCSEVDGEITIPTEEYLGQQNPPVEFGRYWTGIERTGPFSGIVSLFVEFSRISIND